MLKNFLFFIIPLSSLIHASSYERGTEPWGPDADLAYHREASQETKKIALSQKACRSMIQFFQHYISPIDGPRSSYYPTSSQYAMDAILKYGMIKGIMMGCDRLMRENGDPWVYETVDKFGTLRKLDPVR